MDWRTRAMRRRLFEVPLLLWLALAGCSDLSEGGTTSSTGGSSGSTGGGSGGVPGSGNASSGGASSGGAGSGGASIGGSSGQSGSGGAIIGGSSGQSGSGGVSAGGSSGQSGTGGAAIGGGESGSGGAAASGGSGGSSSFQPCPPTGPCKILPLGDSITDGFGVPGGYRIDLFRLALEANKDITFVGRAMNGPDSVAGQTFPRGHEGYIGWRIGQIDDIVPSPALDADPDIVLLHIGTNDIFQSAAGAPERLATLVDQILAELPESLLVVAAIIPLTNSSAAIMAYNSALRALVETRAGQGQHIVFVDQFSGFPSSELDDGVHPNAQGYARMADVWFAAIGDYLQ
jgi:lysophospholipase L1-like esterase